METKRSPLQDPRHGELITYHRFRHDCLLHPVDAIFMAASFSRVWGMNWLQENNLISDNCVDVWEIAPCDVTEIVERAGFRFSPAWLALVLENWQERIKVG